MPMKQYCKPQLAARLTGPLPPLLAVPDAAAYLGWCYYKTLRAIRDESLPSVWIGKRRFVPRSVLEAWYQPANSHRHEDRQA